jgi:hypothetical protein
MTATTAPRPTSSTTRCHGSIARNMSLPRAPQGVPLSGVSYRAAPARRPGGRSWPRIWRGACPGTRRAGCPGSHTMPATKCACRSSGVIASSSAAVTIRSLDASRSIPFPVPFPRPGGCPLSPGRLPGGRDSLRVVQPRRRSAAT